jgi:zinc-finger of transposase IS204/IS1001/IS1096/IS1165
MVAAVARFIPPLLHVDALVVDNDGLVIRATSASLDARCPVCGESAERVHSRAMRTLADLPWAGVAVQLHVHTPSQDFLYTGGSHRWPMSSLTARHRCAKNRASPYR